MILTGTNRSASTAQRLPRLSVFFLAAFIALPLGLLWHGRGTVAFDTDELEHAHAAWCVGKGLVPYRDFFEHHGPALYYLLAPVTRMTAAESGVPNALAALDAARTAAWAFGAALAAMTFFLGAAWKGRDAGLVGAFLLLQTGVFLDKAFEVRPDAASALFLMASLCALLRRPGARTPLWASGLSCGLAMVFSPKAVYGSLGSLAFLLTGKEGGKEKARRVFIWTCGASSPLLVVAALFRAAGGLGALLHFLVGMNLAWKARFSPFIFLSALLRENPLIAALWAIGAWRLGRACVQRTATDGERLLLVSNAALLAGTLALPVPYSQSLLFWLPVAALTAAAGWERLMTPLAARFPAAVRSAGILLAAAIFSSTPRHLSERLKRTNGVQLELIAYVMENSAPGETVLDGWTGLGVFRPHAYFYHFLHREVRLMLDADARKGLLEGLESGAVRPALVLFDRDLRAFSPEVSAFIEENYRPMGGDVVWRRRTRGDQAGVSASSGAARAARKAAP